MAEKVTPVRLRCKLWYAVAALICCALLSGYRRADPVRIDLSGAAQGTTWHIVYFTRSRIITKGQIDSIFMALDNSMSIYKPHSLISQFNASARGIVMDNHLRNVVNRSIKVFSETSHYFDITIFPVVEAWGFAAKKISGIPDSSAIQQLLPCIGSDKIYTHQDSLIKRNPCVKIDVNSIAQGYTVDIIGAFLRRQAIQDYLVEVGGEICVHGRRYPGAVPFTVGIEAPLDETTGAGLMQKLLTMSHGAITTSGNYRKYHESQGKKWSHLMDPHTGHPIHNEMISVTVFAKDAFTADAYDTPLMVMGLTRAMNFVQTKRDLAAYFIFMAPDGTVRDTATANFARLVKQP